MVKTRIAVFISGGGTNLQALIDAQKRREIVSGEIVLVLSSSPQAYGLVRAEEAGITTAVVSRKEAGSQEVFEESIRAVLAEHDIDLIILAGFMKILRCLHRHMTTDTLQV